MRVRIFIAGVAAGTLLGAVGATALVQRRSPQPVAAEATALAVGGDVLKRAADIATAQARWEELHSLCRGGSGDDPLTEQACTAREELASKLQALGYCHYTPGADATPSDYGPLEGWQRCDTLERALANAAP